jgi:poly-gamma-glutamate synthesis protein (capsule biosynthesis protein)
MMPRFFRVLPFFLLVTLSGLTCGSGKPESAAAPEMETVEPLPPEETTVTLIAAGDNLIHDIIYLAAASSDGAETVYNFAPCYEHIKPIVEKADIAFVNQETVLGGTPLKLSGYPVFNSPQEAGIALAGAGFNVVNQASNHSMDRGEKALFATMDFWDAFNKERKEKTLYLGIFRSREERDTRYALIEKKGIRFGFLSYTYGLNGFSLPADKPWLVPLIDREVMAREIGALRPLCDILVVSLHWGNEFSHEPGAEQRELAVFLAGLDVDLVLGHHPHVTQPCEVIKRPGGGTLTCFYSLGDLLSHTQTDLSPDTMLGAMAYITVVKRGTETAAVTTAAVIPSVCHYGKGRLPPFTVYPLWDYTEELAAEHYKSAPISLDYLWNKSREVFGMRVLDKNPFAD